MRELDTVLALADRDDETAGMLLEALGPETVERLLGELRDHELAARRVRNDRPAAFAMVAAIRATQPLTASARPAALLVEQVAGAHVRPSVAIAALSPDVHDAATALLASVATATGRAATALDPVEFIRQVVDAVAASCPLRRGMRGRRHAPTVERMLVLTERYVLRAGRRTGVDHPELTTWRLDTARARLEQFLATAHPIDRHAAPH